MKGSPHKMGKIEGTSGHTSALKQKEAETSATLKQASALKDTGAEHLKKADERVTMDDDGQPVREGATKADKNYARKHDIAHAEETPENPAHEGGPKMKSPVKQDLLGKVIRSFTKENKKNKTGEAMHKKALKKTRGKVNKKALREISRRGGKQ